MTLTNSLQSLVSSDRATVVVPPVNEGPFQGWGIRIS